MGRTAFDRYQLIHDFVRRVEFVDDKLVSSNPVYDILPLFEITEYRQTTNTPGFKLLVYGNTRKKRRLTRLPINGFHYHKDERHYLRGEGQELYDKTLIFWNGPASNLWHGQFDTSTQVLTDADIADIKGQAYDKLLSKIKDQKVNLAQMFGERKQAADMFSTTAKRVVRVVTDLKRGNFGSAASHLDSSFTKATINEYKRLFGRNKREAVANAWLELQYGWKPLLSDVYGAAEQVAQMHLREVKQRFTTSIKRSIGHNFAVGYSEGPKTVHSGREDIEVRVGLTAVATSDETHNLSQLGITNPAHLAWELLPFSFVADWFIPIGGYLANLDATLGLSFQDGYITTFHRVHRDMVQRGTGVHQPSITHRRNFVGRWYYVDCKREALSGFPRPSVPEFKNPFSPEHVLNAMALVSQAFAPGRKRFR